jgi:putative membrane protein
MVDELSGKQGGDFDRAYIAAQKKAHDEAVQLFTAYGDRAENARLKQFARDTLPTLRSHQEHVRKM